MECDCKSKSVINTYLATKIPVIFVDIIFRNKATFFKTIPMDNGHHFADIFKCCFSNKMFCISIPISLEFVHKALIDNKLVLVQAMAWLLTGYKPLPEPMLAQFPDAYMQH